MIFFDFFFMGVFIAKYVIFSKKTCFLIVTSESESAQRVPWRDTLGHANNRVSLTDDTRPHYVSGSACCPRSGLDATNPG